MPKEDLSGKGLKALEPLPAETTELDASGNQIGPSFKEIGALTKLESLELYSNAIKSVPAELANCKSLTMLNLYDNRIMQLPAALGSLTSLTEVNISAQKPGLMKVPAEAFAGWANLQTLTLNDNNLQSQMLGSMAALTSLVEVRLYNNQLAEMPAISLCPALERLELHGNAIATIDDGFFNNTPSLTYLSLQKNKLAGTFPSSILGCSRILFLQLQENAELSALPDGSYPTTLETLFTQDTKIRSVPAGLTACSKMKRCNLGAAALDEVAKKLETITLANPEGIFWDATGEKKQKK